jgi:hypothetical protein
MPATVFAGAREIAELETEFRERDRPDLGAARADKLREDVSIAFEDAVRAFHENVFLTF